jgi:hypothetical protein
VVLEDGSILVIGGDGRFGGSTPSNEVWKSSDGGVNWAVLTTAAWGTRGGTYFLIVSCSSLNLIGTLL